jgi:hypothetical protein
MELENASPEALDAMEKLTNSNFIVGGPFKIVDDAGSPSGYRHDYLHPAQIGPALGNLNNRTFVPLNQLQDFYGWGQNNADAQGRILVPYLSCVDEVLSVYPQCTQYDEGLDAYEVIANTINYFHSHYMMHSFRRSRLTFNHPSYVGFISSRVMAPIKNWQDWLAHAQWEYKRIDPDSFNDGELYDHHQRGVNLAYEFLAQLLAMPEPGGYDRLTVPDQGEAYLFQRQPLSHGQSFPSADATIPWGVGRLYRSFVGEISRGYTTKNVGSAVDKELALETLLDPSFFWFEGRNSYPDDNLWMVSFFRTHPEDLIDLLGGLIAGDWTRTAPTVDEGTGMLTYPDYFTRGSTAGGPPVEIGFHRNLRIRTLIYALALLYTGTTDQTLLEYLRIVDVGAGEDVPTIRTPVDFVHPVTGQTLRAYVFDESGSELGIGARLLQRAQTLSDALAAETDPSLLLRLERLMQEQLDLILVTQQVVRHYEDVIFPGILPKMG